MKFTDGATELSDNEVERLGQEAFIHCGSPLKRWSQITQEERRAWMQGALFGFTAGATHQMQKQRASQSSRPVANGASETEPCPDCHDGGACLPGGCGVPGCTRCGKSCPTCNGSCEVRPGMVKP